MSDARNMSDILEEMGRIEGLVFSRDEVIPIEEYEQLHRQLLNISSGKRPDFIREAMEQASRYFRDAHKSVHVYAHENDATTLRPGRPAAENATMTLRHHAFPASPVNACLPGAPRHHASVE